MLKLLVIPQDKNFTSDLVSGYVLPLEKFSVSYPCTFSLDEIEKEVSAGKEIFVILNKNIFNCEIQELECVLIFLDKIGVAGVFFYDLSVLSIVRRLSLKLFLVWNQTHMVTNYNTINYYLSRGARGAVLSNEITLDEMLEIRKNTEATLFVNVIYRPIMSFSRRNLVSNFCKTNQIFQNKDFILGHDRVSGEDILVSEERDGTAIFCGKIVNGLDALSHFKKNEFDYGIVDVSRISKEYVALCIESVFSLLHADVNESEIRAEVIKAIGDYTGFLYKKTIYRVK